MATQRIFDSWSTGDALILGSVFACTMAMFRMRARIYDLVRKVSNTPLGLESLVKHLNRSNTRDMLKGLVSHRGFHYPSDALERPLENTLAAYERAWSAGVKFCECDVGQTRDGAIVLCHDANLKRLALRPDEPIASRNVTECKFHGELEFFALRDGSRVPTLKEVLSAAKRVGGGAKLVIEIKGDDESCAAALAEMVGQEDLGDYVALAMGFSLLSVKKFSALNPKRGQVLSMLLTVRGTKPPPPYSSASLEATTQLAQSSPEAITVKFVDTSSKLGHARVQKSIEKPTYIEFSLDSMDQVLALIHTNGIDGLYVQYDPAFLSDPRFVDLCKGIPVGIWGRFLFDPDHQNIVKTLLSRGARFVNTDFPDNFFS